jgi:hypothetical protein
VRRDSETSHHSQDSHDTPPAPKEERKMVPAPPPKENAWARPRADPNGPPPAGPSRSADPVTRQVDDHEDNEVQNAAHFDNIFNMQWGTAIFLIKGPSCFF